MERLTAADASFLYMENPTVHMHVTGVLVLDPTTMAGGWSFESLRSHVVARLHRIPAFRRRLVEVPLGIDHPVWVEDPDFDIDEHLHHEVLRAPGTAAELTTYVGNYASEPMDRSRPLWDMVVLEGSADGTVALVTKMHHVAVDGASGNDLMAQLVDLSPDVVDADDGASPPVQRVPSRAGLVAGALVSRSLDPLRSVRAVGRSAVTVGRLARSGVEGLRGGPRMARPFDAPRLPFNQSLTGRRAVAIGRTSLDDLKVVKEAFGTTVNDVFLAACTQSLRAYLMAQDAPVDRPLTCSVPVSVRGRTSDERSANQVSNMFVRLPVDLSDPVAQLRRVSAETADAKSVHGALGADVIGDVTELTPPALFNLASRMYSRLGLAERLPPIHNLVVSNVPGPPVPLYVAGARLVAIHPFGPLTEGAGLNISVISVMGHMDIGVIGCPDIAPHLEDVVAGIVAGVARLVAEAADAGPPPVRRRRSRS